MVDKRNRTQRNGSALYVTIRMQPTHATQCNRCVRDDENVTNLTHPISATNATRDSSRATKCHFRVSRATTLSLVALSRDFGWGVYVGATRLSRATNQLSRATNRFVARDSWFVARDKKKKIFFFRHHKIFHPEKKIFFFRHGCTKNANKARILMF